MKPNQEPQEVKAWKLEHEGNLLKKAIQVNGQPYVLYNDSRKWSRISFAKGFKVSRRDRTSLADHLISEMKKEFTIIPKQ